MNLSEPGGVVLWGGRSNVERWYGSVPRLWGQYVFSDVIRTRLAPSVHGDSSGVRGAAWLWKPTDPVLTCKLLHLAAELHVPKLL